ncbi:HGxxPAAW family protein [Brachybacterium nesterenkovii]|uniref:HGxxPAAW family protein n=1 Tax=Brachybacterium nesterenkovii TaxID=47847 RepID=UPI00321B132A
MPKTYTVPPAPPSNHGRTVAAWLMTVGVVIGSIVAAVGLVLMHTMLMVVGGAVIVATILLSVVLRALGMGQKRRDREAVAQ